MLTIVNPYRKIYLESGKTLEELSYDFHVQRSFIQRLMEGCFPSPPPSINRQFAELGGTTPAALGKKYREYVAASLDALKPPVNPWGEISRLDPTTTRHDYLLWASNLCRVNNVQNTRLKLAALLHVNVNVLNNWENGKTEKLPIQVLNIAHEIEQNWARNKGKQNA